MSDRPAASKGARSAVRQDGGLQDRLGANTRAGRIVNTWANNNVGRNVKGGWPGDPA